VEETRIDTGDPNVRSWMSATAADRREALGHLRARLKILDALTWAHEHRHEALDAAARSATAEDAATAIMRIAGIDADGAGAILDMQVRRWTVETGDRLRAERAECLAYSRVLDAMISQLDS
jgi:DNA gyrase/topoisomerase IV subunit A